MKNDTEFERNTEVAWFSGDKIAPSDQKCRRNLAERDSGIARDWILGIAAIIFVIHAKRLAGGDEKLCGNFVAVVDKEPGAEVETVPERKPVVSQFGRAQAELPVISNSRCVKRTTI